MAELGTNWIAVRDVAPSDDPDWAAANLVTDARAAGIGIIHEKHGDRVLALQIAALTNGAIVAPFVGSVEVHTLELAAIGRGASQQILSHGAATISVGSIDKSFGAVGRGEFAFRLTKFAGLSDVARIILLARVL